VRSILFGVLAATLVIVAPVAAIVLALVWLLQPRRTIVQLPVLLMDMPPSHEAETVTSGNVVRLDDHR